MLRVRGQHVRRSGHMSKTIVLFNWREELNRSVVAMAKAYPPGYDGYIHEHTRAQLLYAVNGSIRMRCALGCWIIPPQRAVWIPPNYPHQTSSVGAMEMRTLYVHPDFCPVDAPRVPIMIGVSPLLRELILRIIAMPPEYGLEGQDARIVATTLAEIDWTPLSPICLPPLEDPRLRAIELAIASIPSDRSTLEQWAARLKTAPRTLTRLIHRETHLSFGKWRDQMRTFAAIPMLSEGRTISEIADAVGFDTASSFTVMFKRLTGILPSRYLPNAPTRLET
jgi:AraC-like DNA-binding protein/quercetin dioxygenase-like cupin family protein